MFDTRFMMDVALHSKSTPIYQAIYTSLPFFLFPDCFYVNDNGYDRDVTYTVNLVRNWLDAPLRARRGTITLIEGLFISR